MKKNNLGHFDYLMFGTYCLVKDVQEFYTNPELSTDYFLDFGLTIGEWVEIYVDVIKIETLLPENQLSRTEIILDKVNPSNEGKNYVSSFEGDIAGYPMLSRINTNSFNVIFQGNMVNELKTECLRLKKSTSNKVALSGLNKLIRMSNLAQKDGLAIYFGGFGK
jgi:hypothetical protein